MITILLFLHFFFCSKIMTGDIRLSATSKHSNSTTVEKCFEKLLLIQHLTLKLVLITQPLFFALLCFLVSHILQYLYFRSI